MKKNLLFFLFLLVLVSCGDGSDKQGERPKESPKEESPKARTRTILFFGDSLTAGYGLEDPALAFPGLIQKRLDSMGFNYRVVNAGVSGETSSGGLGRISWILQQPVDIFILELGANDGLRGVSPTQTETNLQGIMDSVKTRYPTAKIILGGMQVPPSMGQRYTRQFGEIFPRLAKKNEAGLIPFVLQGVGGEPELNLPDGIHPTPEGHKIVAENVWKELEKYLEKPVNP